MPKGKPKGGKYEHTVIKILAKAFAPLGIQEDDIFRTKNSGATKAQPGDIQFSPRFAKIFPVLVECKHYATVKYKLGKSVDHQPASFHLFFWWKQVVREQKERKDKMGILVFRQNNCDDLICLKITHFEQLCGHFPKWQAFSWLMSTSWKNETLVVVPLKEFLPLVVSKIKAQRIIKKRISK
jgi:hypothetical protein